MQAVNVFLARFKDLAPVDTALKVAVVESIERRLKVKLESSAVLVKRSSVYLQASPAIKNLIFLHREAIANDVAEILHEKKRNLL